MRYKPTVGMLVIAPDNMDLLVEQGKTGTRKLPQGTVEPGESLEDAAVREIGEEAGIAEGSILSLAVTDVILTYRYEPKFVEITGYDGARIQYVVVRSETKDVVTDGVEITRHWWLSYGGMMCNLHFPNARQAYHDLRTRAVPSL